LRTEAWIPLTFDFGLGFGPTVGGPASSEATKRSTARSKRTRARSEPPPNPEVAAVPELVVPEATPATIVPLPLPVATPVASAVADATVEPPALVAAALPQRVLVFDVETTGTDKRSDQVIELCVQYGLDGSQSKTWRFKPSCPINPGAQAVHGISMDELADCPAFGEGADEIVAIFADADVVIGYNIAFDIDMLQSEFGRLGRPPIDFHGKTIVDAFRLWQQCEPRSLQHAHKRFVGDSFAAAHSASADVAATARVLEGMLRAFGLHDRDWTAIADVCDPSRASWVGPSRHLQWDVEGSIVITFGKHKGAALHVLARGNDAGYLQWVADKDFPAHVIEICKKAQDLDGDAFLAWARRRYGQPAPTAAPPFAGDSQSPSPSQS
jgi:DNA polymerase-3 subunit epsilon